MLYRYFPLTLVTFCTITALGQTPQSIVLEKGQPAGGPKSPLACADQYAGTISFSNFVGQSNDITPDTIFLCFGDQIDIVHNGDANLSGDPNPLTAPGITYGFFDCPPTVSGPNLATILTDACILDNPPPLGDIWVTAGGNPNGNITFSNSGSLQNLFGGGDPTLIWFAPLTIDNFAIKQYETDPLTGEPGPCVNLNVAEAFAVVYLNEIEVTNLVTNGGLSGCQGSFKVTGGLPQYDGSDYNIVIELLGSPSVTGWVVNGPITHDETVTFQVPLPGIYRILVNDGKNCNSSIALANMSSCENITQSVGSGTGLPGGTICLDVTNQAGFLDIVAIQYGLTWDEAVLEFDTVINLTPLLPGFNYNTSFNNVNDSLIFSWGSLSGIGASLPNGQVLFQVCFNVVGANGECTDIEFIQGPLTDIYNANGDQLGFYGIPGNVCVSASALNVSFTQDSVSCPGSLDGSFTVTVSGGQAPYSITWQNLGGGPILGPATINIDGGSFTVNNIPAGTYQVQITDSQGTPLTTTQQVTVGSPPLFEIVFEQVLPSCNGETGSLSASILLDNVNVPDPTQDFSFSWSNNANTPYNDNLFSGQYTLTVTQNATGCTTSGTIFLQQPLPLQVNVVTVPATCSGVANGSISIAVSGGTPDINGDYTITWPTIGGAGGLTIVSDISTVSGLSADNYQLIIVDDNNCFIQQNVWLPATKVLSANVQVMNVSCNGDCDGSIFASGNTAGGAPSLPYNFSWFGTPVPPVPSNTTPTTSTLSNLCQGVYTLVMQDAAGCMIDTSFTITQPDPLQTSVLSVVNESCTPGNDGAIVIGAFGGTYPYTYIWNIPATDSTLTGLSAGVYSVTVEDNNGCADTISVTVTTPQGPAIVSLLDDEVSCPDSQDGVLSVVAIPGDAPITNYLWSNGGADSFIAGIPPGEYIVTITDANFCTAVDTALVTSPPPLVLTDLNLTSPQCPGLGGGSIAVSVEGGTAPYFFEWSNGLAGTGFNVVGNIPAGDYALTVTDANGCPPLIENITLDDPPSIVAVFSNIDSVSCANTGMTCDGTATAAGGYSDGATGTFSFTWQSGENTSNSVSSTATQLCAGPQTLTISDGLCFIDTVVVIPAPLPISPGQKIQNASCNGYSDGEITLLPSGGTPPYNIVWASGTTGPVLTGLAAGNYTAIITDSKNCTFTHTVTIIEPTPMTVSVNPTQTTDVSCAGDKDGIITVVAQGGNVGLGGVTYLWQDGIAPTTSNSAQNLAPGTYSVTVVDIKGCSDTLTHTVSEPEPVQFTLGDIMPILCFSENTFITVDSVWGGLQPTTYQFSVDGGINRLPGDPSPVFAGTHTITVIDVINGCEVSTTVTLTEPQEVRIELPAVVQIELGDSLTMLEPTIVSSLPIDTFFWSPPDHLSCSDCKNPKVSAIADQLYTLTIVDVNGCSATGQVYVDIDRNRNVYIPNIFSPNGDGINDRFQIFTGLGVTRINFVRIYDRWGELLFEETDLRPSSDGTPGWDGTFKGDKMNPAVFMYLIEVEFQDGRILLYRGDVTLMQ